MELLFFLTILGIQFAYQIYKKIDKKKKIKKSKSSVEKFSDSSTFSEDSTSSFEQQQTMDSPLPSSSHTKTPDSMTKDWYHQLFGFIEEAETALRKSSPIDKETDFISSPDDHIPTSYQEVHEDTPEEAKEDKNFFSYDDSVEKNSFSEYSVSSYSPSRRSAKKLSSNDTLRNTLHLKAMEKTTKKVPSSYRSLIQDQLHNSSSLKNGWRIKFILDPPKSLTREKEFF